MGTSPVVQSLEICLPMQGVWIGSLFGKLRCRVHLSQLSLHATSGEATHSRAHASQQKKSVPGTVEPGGLHLWGHTELDTAEAI